MTDIDSIIQLFEELFDGKPWLDITILGSLEGLTAGQAYAQVLPGRNTIWEIVNHVIDWRLNVLRRVQGETIITPEDNYFKPVTDHSEMNWKYTITRLRDSQLSWLNFLKTFREEDLLKVYPVNGMTFFQHIHGIIQHDAYHLGQINYLAKSL